MNRRDSIKVIAGSAVACWPLVGRAQQAGQVKRIGFLRVGPPPTAWIDGLRQGLRELGYQEGKNVTIEYGLARNAAQLSDAAAKLVRRNVDVLVASGTPSVRPAAKATSTIPVVFVAAVDPLATGLVASLARPGGNITGVTAMSGDVIGKRLELLGELLPKLSRIAILVRTTGPGRTSQLVRFPARRWRLARN